jgi:hypothetical protein
MDNFRASRPSYPPSGQLNIHKNSPGMKNMAACLLKFSGK